MGGSISLSPLYELQRHAPFLQRTQTHLMAPRATATIEHLADATSLVDTLEAGVIWVSNTSPDDASSSPEWRRPAERTTRRRDSPGLGRLRTTISDPGLLNRWHEAEGHHYLRNQQQPPEPPRRRLPRCHLQHIQTRQLSDSLHCAAVHRCLPYPGLGYSPVQLLCSCSGTKVC